MLLADGSHNGIHEGGGENGISTDAGPYMKNADRTLKVISSNMLYVTYPAHGHTCVAHCGTYMY